MKNTPTGVFFGGPKAYLLTKGERSDSFSQECFGVAVQSKRYQQRLHLVQT
jgi:hypothetical protein